MSVELKCLKKSLNEKNLMDMNYYPSEMSDLETVHWIG